MKKYVCIFFSVPALLFGFASARDQASCVVNVEELLAANGETGDAAAFCECALPMVEASASLKAELEEYGGLPSREEASEEMIEVVESCRS